jgi:hypothetical protein
MKLLLLLSLISSSFASDLYCLARKGGDSSIGGADIEYDTVCSDGTYQSVGRRIFAILFIPIPGQHKYSIKKLHKYMSEEKNLELHSAFQGPYAWDATWFDRNIHMDACGVGTKLFTTASQKDDKFCLVAKYNEKVVGTSKTSIADYSITCEEDKELVLEGYNSQELKAHMDRFNYSEVATFKQDDKNNKFTGMLNCDATRRHPYESDRGVMRASEEYKLYKLD